MTTPQSVVQVGLGGRADMYYQSIVERYSASYRLAAVCDINPGRLQRVIDWSVAHGQAVPGYRDYDFDRMLAECRPALVVVTTMDATHDDYICRALAAGCNVITEKPMTIDAERCLRILDAQRQSGKQLRVTFNYRYAPPRTQIKDILMRGVIGDVLSVDFHWMLDTSHGADYFRRWHRNKVNSGGLLVHKSTHHFDLVNWWLSTVPTRVFATGDRRFYTPQHAERLGLQGRGERCLHCADATRCPFYLDLATNESLHSLYLDHEHHDGYFRDRCVFAEEIDIEDNMQVIVDYASGARMSYSLHAFMPWEGYTITFNGTKGRIEHKCEESVYINGDGTVPGALKQEGTWTHIFPQFAPAYEVEVWQGEGGHGGGDDRLLDDLFGESHSDDPYGRVADQRAGAYSIVTGIAANQSIATGLPVSVNDILPGVAVPDYPACMREVIA